MARNPRAGHPAPLHPFHAAMLAGAATLFIGALLADWAYARSYQIEWSNFASWLLVGAMALATIALACAIAGWLRARASGGGAGRAIHVLVLAAAWVVGLFDALRHARDAWAIMPAALVLSLVAALLACVATWIGFSTLRAERVGRAGDAA